MSGPPLRVVQVGAGGMGQTWLGALAANPDVQLVGVVDLDLAAARAAVEAYAPGAPAGADLLEVATAGEAQAVVDVTVPAAHHPVTQQALLAGLPVLGEKPAAASVAEALSLAATAEVTGRLFMVSQSRRYDRRLSTLRGYVRSLGVLGSVTTEFARAPHFGGFREQMAHPLLVDMAIHPFDTVRHLLGADPVAVRCETWNPSWSWYAGDACATAHVELTGGARFGYTGSWCAPGLETSWNGAWRVSGARGSATWDGEGPPQVESTEPVPAVPEPGPDGIAGALVAFVRALRTGEPPHGEIHENLLSLAMVEAAVLSADEGRRVLLDDVLARAHETAVAGERHPEVAAVLRRGVRPVSP